MKPVIKKLYSIYKQNPIISTDSRNIQKGAIFFALKGDNFDGNKFAHEAIKKGASYAVVDSPDLITETRFIRTDNSLLTLQELAAYHRDHLNIPFIGITGTNGKTTTKELIGKVLSKKYKTFFTTGNLNNHIGVPLSVLSVSDKHEMAVIEMGANHIGEIEQLCNIAKPDYGLITNIGKAHLEGFGSFEGVQKAKSELYNYLKSKNKSLIFINNNNDLLLKLSSDLLKYSYGTFNANCLFKNIKADPFVKLDWRDTKIDSRLLGLYNAENIMAAVCIGNYFNVPSDKIKEAIKEYIPKNQRSEWIETTSNKIILDAYNANPDSMSAALNNFDLMDMPNKIVILGDMFELGNYSQSEHQNIIDRISIMDLSKIILIGTEFGKCRINELHHFTSTSEAIKYLKIHSIKNSSILMKGSRGMELETLLNLL